MSTLKQWIMQLRYPYTAGVVALMWMGSALIVVIRPELSGQAVVLWVGGATLIVAAVGFSSKSH